MKEKQDMKALAEKLVDYGKKNGATDIQVTIATGTDFSAEIREGNIEKLQQAGSRNLSIKVIVDNKTAVASSSDFTDDTLHKLVDNAVKRAGLTSEDQYSKLPEKEEIKEGYEQLGIYDPQVMQVSPEDKIKAAREVEKIALADSRIKKSGGSWYGTDESEFVIANSNGFSGAYKSTNCSSGVYLQAGDDGNMFEDGWQSSSRNLNGLLSPEEIARVAINNVTRLISAKKVNTQKVPVVFEPRMTSRILGFLAQCISGGAIYMNQSFLAGMIGKEVAVKDIKIIDDGLLKNGHGTRPFDREGVPSGTKPVIEGGLLKNYLLDTYSANKLGMKSTGNASGPNNFYIEAGPYAPDDIIKSVKNGLYLTRTIGQGTVPTSGDISTGAYGIWIENGKLAFPVAEITISGNLGEMLKNIKMVGSDLVFDRSIAGPTILIEGMTISGT